MENCLIILFGVSGDLAKKRILPALYDLINAPDVKNIKILGVARRKLSNSNIIQNSRIYLRNLDAKNIKKFKQNFHYFQLQFNDSNQFKDLTSYIKNIEKKYSINNKIFYLSISPEYYEPILMNFKNLDLENSKGYNRIIIEKPFGYDLNSAIKINNLLKKFFNEKDIFRIDHYLGKDIVQDVVTLRFTNRIIKPIWKNEHINHIQIISTESVGIESRGEYYDKFGALKDFVQSHVIQLLALTTLHEPEKLTEEFIRNHKINILKNIEIKEVVFGQYKGYRNELQVNKDSKTETLAAIKLFINLPNWKNIPIYILHGKCLKDKLTTIYVEFNQSECLMLGNKCDYYPNYLNLQIYPHEGFYLRLNTRNPINDEIVPVIMSYCHECIFGHWTANAYNKLICEVIKGNQLLFIRSDEVIEQWKIIEKINRKKSKLFFYDKGKIPSQVKNFIEKDGYSWHLKIDKPNIVVQDGELKNK